MNDGIQVGSLSDILDRDRCVTDFSDNGKCSNCGACCNDIIPLTNSDINRIKIYVKKNNIKPINHCLLMTKAIDTVCPFRDSINKKCVIYEVRPAICRSFLCHDYLKVLMKNHEKFKDVSSKSMRLSIYGEY